MRDKVSVDKERELAEFIAGFYDDPLGFVTAVFPWGEPTLADGSFNPLHDKDGPEDWQREELIALGDHIKENQIRLDLGLEMKVYRLAIASGHGVGKSAIVSWIILFLMSTRVDTRMAITASTQFQLEDKTWPELSKWHNLAINRHWFVWTATALSFAAYPEERRKNYRATAATVSETNTEAFAGLHNEGRTVAVVFDEASGVLPKIWEVAEGALTDGEAFFFAFGNPTQPEGEFPNCFDKHAHIYRTRHVDSREVRLTNKSALQDIIDKYGEDSDEVKVRIRGLFPSQSYNGFILADSVREARQRQIRSDPGAALIMAVDVARFGVDRSVIGYRQGRDARSIPMITFKGLDNVKLAEKVAMEINAKRPDAVVIESTGGSGVVDILRDKGYKIHEVHPGSTAVDHLNYVNKRAENWARMRDWLYEDGAIPDDDELAEELTTIRYGYDRHEQRIILEAKKDMKLRGLPSPDKADMLALTFAVSVARRDRNRVQMARPMAITEYDVLEV
jgi:hypothetical protein